MEQKVLIVLPSSSRVERPGNKCLALLNFPDFPLLSALILWEMIRPRFLHPSLSAVWSPQYITAGLI
ncbi:MAG: hypothetical protein ACT4O3_05570 [Elusimicrobiota bacterium]|jgi:hypothetical protein